MTTSFNVNKLWQSFARKSKSNQVNIVAQRFLQIFNDHGVLTTQIPRLLSAIKLDDLKSEDALLAMLTHDVLDQIAHLFGIRVEWLEGVDDEIYEYLACYKRPEIILEHLAQIVGGVDVGLSFPLRVFSTTKKLDCNDDSQQLLAPVLVEKIADLGEERIYRYHIYRDEFNWGYFPTRIELKAIARIVDKNLHTPVPLFVISEEEMRGVLDGKLVPTNLFRGALLTNPSLEDFALTKEESGVAKEVEEIPSVLSYIEEHNLQDFSFAKPETPQQPDEPIASPVTWIAPAVEIPPKKTGKRADNNQDLWEPVRAVAGALWAEDDSLSIAEVITRIQKMSHLKASKLTASAIRKHIADLAPPNVRGKSGRKPNKST
jgi:hypothetical protein